MIHLILGGARSGKSVYAEEESRLWQERNNPAEVIYLATARTNYQQESPSSESEPTVDKEMLQRIEHHRNQRPDHWTTLEEPLYLARSLRVIEEDARNSQQKTAVLIDCLTLWMLNLIDAGCRESETEQFLRQLEKSRLPIVIVSNEVGLGVVPMGKLSREFVDELGRLHQAVAKRANRVTFVTAGLPMSLKN